MMMLALIFATTSCDDVLEQKAVDAFNDRITSYNVCYTKLLRGPYAENLLKGKVTDEMLDAIVMHNEVATGKERTSEFQLV